ncbi:MAG: hypothetical protein ABJA84_07470 [Polaromonas sp.]
MPELLKPLVVFAHLLATCIALGAVLLADHRLWRWRQRRPSTVMVAQLRETQQVVSLGLAALWCSGALLVALGYWQEGAHYLLNPKLWAKVSVVSLLTLNGIALHRIGFPLLQRAALVALPWREQARLGLLGALSGTGWLFAAFLGIARHWNHVLPYPRIMALFAGALLTAALLALSALGLARRLPQRHSQTQAAARCARTATCRPEATGRPGPGRAPACSRPASPSLLSTHLSQVR